MGQPIDNARAVLYGRMVEAAYRMFKNPQGGNPLLPEPDGIPNGWELGAWIHMSDFVLSLEQPKFYGIVVHELANPDSRIIAIRGTEGPVEWLDDGDAIPVPFRQVPNAGRVAHGFDRIYNSLKVVKRKLPALAARGESQRPAEAIAAAAAAPETFGGSFAEQLDQEASSREGERGLARPHTESVQRRTRPTVVTGHSLGAALATLFVMENAVKRKFDIATLCTFASPRVGTMQFVHLFNQLPINSWRVVNIHDVVPKLPPHVPLLLDYGHVDTAYPFDSSLFAKNNLLCWHTMETYLHSLDNTLPLLPGC